MLFLPVYFSYLESYDSRLWLILLMSSSNRFCKYIFLHSFFSPVIAEVLSIVHLLRKRTVLFVKDIFFSLISSKQVTTREVFLKRCFPGDFSSLDLSRSLWIIKDFFPVKFQIQCLLAISIFYHYPACLSCSCNGILKKRIKRPK